MTPKHSVPFSQLFDLSREPRDAAFFVTSRPRNSRYFVEEILEASPTVRGSFAQPRDVAQIGDNPQQLNPRYVMAILSARAEDAAKLRDFPIPIIEFSTAENVRRSMTLNSMRMSLEYFGNGSLRLLDLVENRLAESQHDVVHDLCVYLMRHLLDIRARERESRFLRAESVAAFLGLDEKKVRQLFLARRVSALPIAQQLESGVAGTIRRALNVETLVAQQTALLQPQLSEFAVEEKQLFTLLDEVVARLRNEKT